MGSKSRNRRYGSRLTWLGCEKSRLLEIFGLTFNCMISVSSIYKIFFASVVYHTSCMVQPLKDSCRSPRLVTCKDFLRMGRSQSASSICNRLPSADEESEIQWGLGLSRRPTPFRTQTHSKDEKKTHRCTVVRKVIYNTSQGFQTCESYAESKPFLRL